MVTTPYPGGFQVPGKVTNSHSLSLQDQWLLWPSARPEPFLSLFPLSGIPKGDRWRRKGLPPLQSQAALYASVSLGFLNPLHRHQTPSQRRTLQQHDPRHLLTQL